MAAPPARGIMTRITARIPAVKARRSVDFVPALPQGGTGKILKREVRERSWADQAKRVH